ncbi:hypothetical protein BASA81_000236 [Batrachochytrium salamandrivorans]|nr:hypothetical protein BASA81_012655 [Batrachochytrium salamandrivorans]KAH9261580.1 hypothetical protein BASA81_000236 [Batrachochytrium salamandrivorans]
MNSKQFRDKVKAGKKLAQEKKSGNSAKESEDLLAKTPGEESEEEIKIDFTFCDSRGEDDEMWIRTLLQKGWTGKCVLQNEDAELRKLGKAISEQVVCGTFVKTEEEDAIYAFMTVLSAGEHMLPSLLSKLPASTGQRLGWLVREKIVNIPEDTTYPLLDCLVQDLKHAETDDYLVFDSIIILAPCFKLNQQQDDDGQVTKKKKKQRLVADSQAVDYCLYEDAVFANAATSSTLVQFPKPQVADDVDEMPDTFPLFCNALVLTKQAFVDTVKSLQGI